MTQDLTTWVHHCIAKVLHHLYLRCWTKGWPKLSQDIWDREKPWIINTTYHVMCTYVHCMHLHMYCIFLKTPKTFWVQTSWAGETLFQGVTPFFWLYSSREQSPLGNIWWPGGDCWYHAQTNTEARRLLRLGPGWHLQFWTRRCGHSWLSTTIITIIIIIIINNKNHQW